MPAVLAKITGFPNGQLWTGGVGVNAADVVIQTNDISAFDNFELFSTAGVMTVFGSLDGATYGTAPLSLQDMGAVSVGETYVTVTVANRYYRLRGTFKNLQVQQSGATAVANGTMLMQRTGHQ